MRFKTEIERIEHDIEYWKQLGCVYTIVHYETEDPPIRMYLDWIWQHVEDLEQELHLWKTNPPQCYTPSS